MSFSALLIYTWLGFGLSSPGENIGLCSGRNIYCVGEDIYFTLSYSSSEIEAVRPWSTVVYIELIAWDGARMAAQKLKLGNGGTSGIISIPATMVSGNYYLRAYTRWMRNWGPALYPCLPLKIVNPFSPDTYAGPADTALHRKAKATGLFHDVRKKEMECRMDKTVYRAGERAYVELGLTENIEDPGEGFCVSVVRSGLQDMDMSALMKPEAGVVRGEVPMEYLPEIRGLSISGKLLKNGEGEPLSGVLLSLCTPAGGDYYSVYKSRADGAFVFVLPDLKGSYDFFLQTQDVDSLETEMLVDNAYCSRPLKLPFVPFTLSAEELPLVREMVITQQLREKFFTEAIPGKDYHRGSMDHQAFYGTTLKAYRTDDYIELPNLEEYITEIVREFIVDYGGQGMRIKNAQRTSFPDHPPLVLMDFVPVDNDGQILAIPLNRIERVEVIGRAYVAGGTIYNGLISILSRRGDFAGVDLSRNGMFFTQDMLAEPMDFACAAKSPGGGRTIERANQLYWDPDLRLGPDKKAGISFLIPDSPGYYTVYIRSKSSTGSGRIGASAQFTIE